MKATAIRLVVCLVLLLGLLLSVAYPSGNGWAQEGQGPDDPAELEAFLDGLMAGYLADKNIAGATLSVVKDGKLLFTKGYGYSDVEQQAPVDPETVLFRIGSITKLFTWTAVMQLVEQGKLDLDQDVNTYLDFEIPATYIEPITLEHLLTHTPGFEDQSIGMAAATPQDLLPLDEWLKNNLPARVRPPGQFSSYSNYGAALAGYIVQRTAHMPYEEYVETNILAPLGMLDTTPRQPLPQAFVEGMSTGYRYVDGGFQAQDFELIQGAPAGAASSTATDMAEFMIAHLQDGEYGGARILEPETAQLMHNRLFAHNERLNGFAHGFYEMDMNGQHIIGHGGDTVYFHSLMTLFPEHDLGLFFSFNSEGEPLMQEEFLDAFVEHYFPITEAPLSPPEDFQSRAGRYEGSYRLNRMSYTTFEKILMGLLMPINVRSTDDGALVVSSTLTGDWRFVEVEPLVFHQVNGLNKAVFREDENGDIRYLLLNNMPMMVAEKMPWYEAATFHTNLLVICLLLFLTVPICAVVGFFVNRVKGTLPSPRPAVAARAVLLTLSLLVFVFLIVLLGSLVDQVTAMTGGSPSLQLALAIPYLLLILTIAVLVFTVLAWKDGYWHISGRVHYTLVALAALAFTLSLVYWNFLF